MDVTRMPESAATGGPSRQELLRIYEQTKTIAVVRASADERKPAQVIPEYLQSQGYRIIPVNPKGGEILGERVYTSLEEIEVAVDVVEIFRPVAEAETIAREAVGIGADVVWFQLGTHTTEAIQLVADGGLLWSLGVAWVRRTANWVSDQDHPGPFGGRYLRSHNESAQVPNGSRFCREGGPIEVLMRYEVATLTTEKGRE